MVSGKRKRCLLGVPAPYTGVNLQALQLLNEAVLENLERHSQEATNTMFPVCVFRA